MKNIPHTFDFVTVYTIFDDLVCILYPKSPVIGRKPELSISECLTISLFMIHSHIRELKILYRHLLVYHSGDFHLPCYKNFVETMNRNTPYLIVVLNIFTHLMKSASGVVLVDSTPLPVCKNIRINNHRVMKQIATRSRSTMGWFYGLKLHLCTDTKGNIIRLAFTIGSVDDRVVLDAFLKELSGMIFVADAGYVSKKLCYEASKYGNILKTCCRVTMKKIATKFDIHLLNLRNRVEGVFSVLKDRLNLVTSLPRSITGYIAHYVRVLFGYILYKTIS